MSKHFALTATFALLLVVGARSIAATTTAGSQVAEPRLNTYLAGDGTAYYALSLSPNVDVKPAANREIVILFDTSASQTSVFREKGLAALAALNAGLDRGDRVRLFAVDLDAVPLTADFVAPRSAEMDSAIAALKARAPLGATDMPVVLEVAARSFSGKSASKTVIYIGDGVSSAHFMALDGYRKLVEELVAAQVSVSSFGVGPRTDGPVLASLANQTGGVLAIDDEEMDGKAAGQFLASAAHAGVLWPTNVAWPKEFAEVYPTRMPPLRTDRDTIVLAKGAAISGEVGIRGTFSGPSNTPVSVNWTLAAGASNSDFAFLPAVVEAAHSDGGARLICVGTPGLNEMRRLVGDSAQTLAKLGQQAVSVGNLETADRLVDEALKRDPNDETAQAVKKQLAKLRTAESEDEKTDGGKNGDDKPAKNEQALKLKKFSSKQAAPPSPFSLAKYRKPEATEVEVGDGSGDVNDAQGQLLSDVESQNRLITQLIRAEVENELREARTRMERDPLAVEQELKLMMERVVKAPELKAEVRAQLRGQLETALREASRRAATKDIIDQQIQQAKAANLDRQRIADALNRDQEKLKQLMDRFDSLMDEGRYNAADEIGEVEVPPVAHDAPIAASASLVAHATGARMANLAQRLARQKAVIDTLAPVEVALIPFPDDQPVVYPDASSWEELTLRRKRYARTDLKQVGPAEKKIREALEQDTTMDFTEMPLQDAVDYLKDLHSIEIQLDGKALEESGIGTDTPVTRNLKGVSLRSALRLLLNPMDLTTIIKDEVLLITTKEKADTELVTKTYPVADLVIPVRPIGGMMGGGGMGMGMGGGMGGGMMGGMGGGMGGGMMGGMGGGMGGGMMGGMGGGMGGGMFSVPDAIPDKARPFAAFAVQDDLKLTPKSKEQAKSAPPANGTGARAKSAAQAEAKTAPQVSAQPNAGKPAQKVTAIKLPSDADADPEIAWNDYFAAHENIKPEALRETARQLMHAKKFGEVIAMIQAALRSGQPQVWMYEAMSLAMQASGAPKAEIERALMSAVDLGDNAEDIMYVAQYMARVGLEQRALKVFHQVAVLEPLRPEPYLYGLQLAQRIGDLEGLKWSSLGILRQAWPREKHDAVQSAKRAAEVVLAELKTQNRTAEAAEFQAALSKANERDCLVRVTWTGDADIDILVEEPSGTVCSFRNPRTTGGGVILDDSLSKDSRTAAQGMSETYVCPEAFNGTYRVRVRRVWGKVATGKVTVDVYSHYGTKQEKHIRQQIALGDQDALLVFDVKDGRRLEPLGEQQLANAAAGQLAVNQAILAQQIGSMADPGSAANLATSRQGLIGIPFIQQAVGYMPVITVLPSGASMTTLGVVSADRRYVRVAPAPFFTGISSVTTFNLQSGTGSTTGGTQGGTQPGQTPPGASGGTGTGTGGAAS